ncbi:MAG TPA: HepT-like ribonuclease domain-containing protein [Stellaceae bacterium]|nr:HepT-like ribonuclease domain-containing protein [Stellaceae bacterium]
MIDAAEAACRFVNGRRRADLEADRMLAFAVMRAVELVGEAASRVSKANRVTLRPGHLRGTSRSPGQTRR